MTSAPSSTPLPGARHPRDTPGLSTPLKTPHTLTDDQQVVEVEPNISSGVGVLDKAALILSCLEAGPVTLGQLVKATGLAGGFRSGFKSASPCNRRVGTGLPASGKLARMRSIRRTSRWAA